MSNYLLTLAEAAERLRMSERNVRRLIAAGELPALQGGRGRRVFVEEAAIDAYLRPSWIVRAEQAAN